MRALLRLLQDFNGFVLAYAEQVPLWPDVESVLMGGMVLGNDQEVADYDDGDDDSDEFLREAVNVHFNETTYEEQEDVEESGLEALLQEFAAGGAHAGVDLNAIFAALFPEGLDVNGVDPCAQ